MINKKMGVKQKYIQVDFYYYYIYNSAMNITVNGKNINVENNTTIYDLTLLLNIESDLFIVNSFPVDKSYILNENDNVSLIKKGQMPDKEHLEYLLFSRQGVEVYNKLKTSKVVVCGIGGLGSHVAISLARSGVGTIKIIDYDVVEPSNINRQSYFINQIGLNKTDALKETNLVFTGDWAEAPDGETVYESVVIRDISLYPILKQGEYIPVYSNMSDTVYSVGMVADEVNGGFVFPKETVLLTTTNVSTRGATSIDGRVISAQFVGYSLVTIGNDGNRTSEKLYKAGDTLPEGELAAYSNDTRRIYAVWTQIQNIPGASIYQNGDESKNGLFYLKLSFFSPLNYNFQSFVLV